MHALITSSALQLAAGISKMYNNGYCCRYDGLTMHNDRSFCKAYNRKRLLAAFFITYFVLSYLKNLNLFNDCILITSLTLLLAGKKCTTIDIDVTAMVLLCTIIGRDENLTISHFTSKVNLN
jgi:hypothetical protein